MANLQASGIAEEVTFGGKLEAELMLEVEHEFMFDQMGLDDIRPYIVPNLPKPRQHELMLIKLEEMRRYAPQGRETYKICYIPAFLLWLGDEGFPQGQKKPFELLPDSSMVTFVYEGGDLGISGFIFWKTKNNSKSFLAPLPPTLNRQLMFVFVSSKWNAILEYDFLTCLKELEETEKKVAGIHVMRPTKTP